MLKVGGHLIQDLLHPVPDTAHSPWDAVIDPLHGDLSGTIPVSSHPPLTQSSRDRFFMRLLESSCHGLKASGTQHQDDDDNDKNNKEDNNGKRNSRNTTKNTINKKNNETGPPTIIRLTVPPPSSPPPPPPSVETFREKAEC